MTLMLLMVVEIGDALAIGFALGRIWQIRYDLEEQRAVGFTAPPIARIRNLDLLLSDGASEGRT